jgi:hypothetical protein
MVVETPAREKEPQSLNNAFKLFVPKDLPQIPESVSPWLQQLMSDCWADDPDDRPSFYEILKRLKGRNYRVFEGVKSAKIAKVVKKVKRDEAANAPFD